MDNQIFEQPQIQESKEPRNYVKLKDLQVYKEFVLDKHKAGMRQEAIRAALKKEQGVDLKPHTLKRILDKWGVSNKSLTKSRKLYIRRSLEKRRRNNKPDPKVKLRRSGRVLDSQELKEIMDLESDYFEGIESSPSEISLTAPTPGRDIDDSEKVSGHESDRTSPEIINEALWISNTTEKPVNIDIEDNYMSEDGDSDEQQGGDSIEKLQEVILRKVKTLAIEEEVEGEDWIYDFEATIEHEVENLQPQTPLEYRGSCWCSSLPTLQVDSSTITCHVELERSLRNNGDLEAGIKELALEVIEEKISLLQEECQPSRFKGGLELDDGYAEIPFQSFTCMEKVKGVIRNRVKGLGIKENEDEFDSIMLADLVDICTFSKALRLRMILEGCLVAPAPHTLKCECGDTVYFPSDIEELTSIIARLEGSIKIFGSLSYNTAICFYDICDLISERFNCECCAISWPWNHDHDQGFLVHSFHVLMQKAGTFAVKILRALETISIGGRSIWVANCLDFLERIHENVLSSSRAEDQCWLSSSYSIPLRLGRSTKASDKKTGKMHIATHRSPTICDLDRSRLSKLYGTLTILQNLKESHINKKPIDNITDMNKALIHFTIRLADRASLSKAYTEILNTIISSTTSFLKQFASFMDMKSYAILFLARGAVYAKLRQLTFSLEAFFEVLNYSETQKRHHLLGFSSIALIGISKVMGYRGPVLYRSLEPALRYVCKRYIAYRLEQRDNKVYIQTGVSTYWNTYKAYLMQRKEEKYRKILAFQPTLRAPTPDLQDYLYRHSVEAWLYSQGAYDVPDKMELCDRISELGDADNGIQPESVTMTAEEELTIITQQYREAEAMGRGDW